MKRYKFYALCVLLNGSRSCVSGIVEAYDINEAFVKMFFIIRRDVFKMERVLSLMIDEV